MTNGSVSPQQSGSNSPRETRLSRRVSSLNITRPELASSKSKSFSDGEPSPKGTPGKISKPDKHGLTRQVSQDGLSSFSEKENDAKKPASECGRSTPIHCVSEFDKVTATSLKTVDESVTLKSDKEMTNVQNHASEHSHTLFALHEKSLRIEADLHPMRLILFRLMTHLSFNRRGIFNSPVDPVSLGLVDYFSIITTPMDLGTVKNRLHSMTYQSRREVADDIRLCFHNAMTYNLPHNTVHISAKELLAFFEDQIACFCPDLVHSFPLTFQCLSHSEGIQHSPATTSELPTAISDSPAFRCIDSLAVSLSAIPSSISPSVESTNTLTGSTVVCSADRPVHFFPMIAPPKRKKRGSKSKLGHNCQGCEGAVCHICEQGCLSLEPTLLICNGLQCAGARIRKSVTYYIAPDGSCQYCQRCYTGLAAVLPQSGKHDDIELCRYKRDLLKRKNEEEIVEQWINCSQCQSSVHMMCAFYDPYVHVKADYVCPTCNEKNGDIVGDRINGRSPHEENVYSFMAGSDVPGPIADMQHGTYRMGIGRVGAGALSVTAVSSFIEKKVRELLISGGVANSEKTIVVRIISECERHFKIPDVIRKHFHMCSNEGDASITPPLKVKYRSKAIALFQTIDGIDVCIFCMYVQEYDTKDDEFDDPSEKVRAKQEKRVYVAYIDSVEHFRPRAIRSLVYQEMLTAYLATARLRGFESAHIWACPPSRGNSFVFNNHPATQRTPSMERLTAWYHAALTRAMECGVVMDVQSLYQSDFEDFINQINHSTSSKRIPCPPLLEGDYWIEEALRVHRVAFFRNGKATTSALDDSLSLTASDGTTGNFHCPSLQIATMLRDKIISHSLAVAFRRPVNAAALKLTDYHSIITTPMDLGTVHSRCVLGEYRILNEFVADVELVFSNARRFNPPGHPVYMAATELGDIFLSLLNNITESWVTPSSLKHSWKDVADMSMSLDATLTAFGDVVLVEGPSNVEVVEERKSGYSGSSISSTNETLIHDKFTLVTCEGPSSVQLKMVGSDVWLLDKKNSAPPKTNQPSKRGRKNADVSVELPEAKRRRQTWLGEEIAASVRRMRTSFFKCSLVTGSSKNADAFLQYAHSFKPDGDRALRSSRVADARHALLEFSQCRNLEFDTLRRAKYSTAVLLYHLHNEGAPGLLSRCTSCCHEIESIRWHRINKVVQHRAPTIPPPVGRKRKSETSCQSKAEELCSPCYLKHPHRDQFIPLQVSL